MKWLMLSVAGLMVAIWLCHGHPALLLVASFWATGSAVIACADEGVYPRDFLPLRRCLWCKRLFFGLPTWSWIRWRVPEFCSKRCCDNDMETTDRMFQ